MQIFAKKVFIFLLEQIYLMNTKSLQSKELSTGMSDYDGNDENNNWSLPK